MAKAAGIVSHAGGTLTDCGGCRLTLIASIAVVSAPLLGACFGSDDSKKPWMAHDQKCEQVGFKQGTPERINCRFETGAPGGTTRGRTGDRLAAATGAPLSRSAGRQSPALLVGIAEQGLGGPGSQRVPGEPGWCTTCR